MPVMPVALADAVTAAAASTSTAPSEPSTSQTATSAFGLGFESLLKIVLTQLTYQDPLKPMDNFEFVSQLAQFSQIQQGQTIADRLQSLVAGQSTSMSASLLGRQVDVAAGSSTVSGIVKAVSLQNGEVKLTIQTAQGATISGLALTSVIQIREGS